jgi:hypothetical protein
VNYIGYISVMAMAGHVARIGEKSDAYKILMGKPERKRPLGRPRYRWANDIKIDLERYDGMVWIGWIWFTTGISGELL